MIPFWSHIINNTCYNIMDVVHGSSIISAKRADSSCTKRRTYFNKLYQKVCHFKGYIILYYIIPLVWWHTLLDGNEIVKIKLKTFRVKTGTQPSCKPRGTCTTTHVGSRVKMCPAFTRCKILEYIQTFEKWRNTWRSCVKLEISSYIHERYWVPFQKIHNYGPIKWK